MADLQHRSGDWLVGLLHPLLLEKMYCKRVFYAVEKLLQQNQLLLAAAQAIAWATATQSVTQWQYMLAWHGNGCRAAE
jgi:hypothetical protein